MPFDYLKVFEAINNHKNDAEIDSFMKKIIDIYADIKPNKD